MNNGLPRQSPEVVLGLVILSQWPFAAGWVLGVLVGVDLVSSGWWMLAIAARWAG